MNTTNIQSKGQFAARSRIRRSFGLKIQVLGITVGFALLTSCVSSRQINHSASIRPSIEPNKNILLSEAASDGNLPEVQRLVSGGVDINETNHLGYRYPALMAACIGGHEEVVKFLLDIGANANAKAGGTTALIVASERGYQRIVHLLLAKGAVVNAEGAGQVYVINDRFAIIPGEGTALMFAAAYGHKEVVQLLIANGADVNANSSASPNDHMGIEGTALLFAALNDQEDVVQELLTPVSDRKGADVNARSQNGWTPLMWASRLGRIEAVETLIRNGADVNIIVEHTNAVAYIEFPSGDIAYKGATFTDKSFATLASETPGAVFHPSGIEKETEKETALSLAATYGH